MIELKPREEPLTDELVAQWVRKYRVLQKDGHVRDPLGVLEEEMRNRAGYAFLSAKTHKT